MMVSDPDWKEAYQRLLADGRNRLGPPPTAEQVQALFAGELPEAEVEKVRELLAYYPEMARAMTDPFPLDVRDDSTAEQRAAEMARLRAAVGLPPAPPPTLPKPIPIAERRRPQRQLAAAAVIVVLLALGGISAWIFSGGPSEDRILHADGQRSVSRGETEQTPIQLFTQTRYHFNFVFRPQRSYRAFQLDLIDLSGHSLWSREGVERQGNGEFPVDFSTKRLSPGLYRFRLFGVDDKPELLATYTIRLSDRPPS